MESALTTSEKNSKHKTTREPVSTVFGPQISDNFIHRFVNIRQHARLTDGLSTSTTIKQLPTTIQGMLCH